MYAAHNIEVPNKNLPVSLEYVKQNLRLDDLSQADDLIIGIIRACSGHIERQYGMALLTQTVKEYWTKFPIDSAMPMILRIKPVSEILSIKYMDGTGIERTWDSENHLIGRYNSDFFVVPKLGKYWPQATEHPNSVTITYKAGFGTAIDSIPTDIRDAITLMASARFEKPDDPVITLPRASELLLAPYFKYAA